jgi:hypothetical protein
MKGWGGGGEARDDAIKKGPEGPGDHCSLVSRISAAA